MRDSIDRSLGFFWVIQDLGFCLMNMLEHLLCVRQAAGKLGKKKNLQESNTGGKAQPPRELASATISAEMKLATLKFTRFF